MLVAAARRKRLSTAVENPRPHHRARVHSPSPSASEEVEIVVNPRPPRGNNGPPKVQHDNATLPQMAEVSATDPLPRQTRVRRPTIVDQLPVRDIIDWQRNIRETPQVVTAFDPKITGNKASGLGGFMILALNAISRKMPVPTHDVQLRVTEANVPSLYSLLVKYPSFFA